jgi:hypothetical protein
MPLLAGSNRENQNEHGILMDGWTMATDNTKQMKRPRK